MHKRTAFTLIEVMVAVMIVSVVIAAIYKMQGDVHNMFFKFKEKSMNNQYLSFLVGNEAYGFEKDNIDAYRLVEDFKLEDTLRHELKNIKLTIEYDKVRDIDTAEYDGNTSGAIFEIGKSTLSRDNFSASLYRVKLQ
ncbi:type IV pilus modification PilV family protein [Sulfurimonas sp.]